MILSLHDGTFYSDSLSVVSVVAVQCSKFDLDVP